MTRKIKVVYKRRRCVNYISSVIRAGYINQVKRTTSDPDKVKVTMCWHCCLRGVVCQRLAQTFHKRHRQMENTSQLLEQQARRGDTSGAAGATGDVTTMGWGEGGGERGWGRCYCLVVQCSIELLTTRRVLALNTKKRVSQ